MKFTRDEAKRSANLVKHGLDFTAAETVFRGVTFSFEDDRLEYGERRFITIGMLDDSAVVIAHTEEDDTIRVISMRKATRREQQLYYRAFVEGWGRE